MNNESKKLERLITPVKKKRPEESVALETPDIVTEASKMIQNIEMDEYNVKRRKNMIFVSGNLRSGRRITLKIEETPHGSSMTATNYDMTKKKSEYMDEILRLSKNHTQEEIAATLGMSQSQVSKLKRKALLINK